MDVWKRSLTPPGYVKLKPLGVPKSHPLSMGLLVLSQSPQMLRSGAQLAQVSSLKEKNNILIFLMKFLGIKEEMWVSSDLSYGIVKMV